MFGKTFRKLAAVAAGAVVTLAAFASPAHADTLPVQGCAGSPDVPDTFFCIYLDPRPLGVPPYTTTGPTTYSTFIPRICYVAGCTAAVPVDVPLPVGLQETPRTNYSVVLVVAHGETTQNYYNGNAAVIVATAPNGTCLLWVERYEPTPQYDSYTIPCPEL